MYSEDNSIELIEKHKIIVPLGLNNSKVLQQPIKGNFYLKTRV